MTKAIIFAFGVLATGISLSTSALACFHFPMLMKEALLVPSAVCALAVNAERQTMASSKAGVLMLVLFNYHHPFCLGDAIGKIIQGVEVNSGFKAAHVSAVPFNS